MIYCIYNVILLLISIINETYQHEVIIEGDIVIDYVSGDKRYGYRNMVRRKGRKWPNGIVPYQISTETGEYNQTYIKNIQSAINEIHTKTCVRFSPREKSDVEFVFMTVNGKPTNTSSACKSHVGRMKGQCIAEVK